MAIKRYKPYTPSRRFITVEDYAEVTKRTPEKSLVEPIRKTGGRNNTGQIMVRHIGGGHKRMYRLVDFRRNKHGVPARVATIEYDPNRSALIALLFYKDGEKRYILQPAGLKVGDMVESGPNAEVRLGNALPLASIPAGTFVHNIELIPGLGGKMVRSAGAAAQIMGRDRGFAQLRMPSGEIRIVPETCYGTIGQVGNAEHENRVLGNAGRSRHLGIRPTVRGTAMNAVDHPHGGGRGKSKGNNQPRSPWNQPAKGFRTRKAKLHDWMIVRRRAKKSEGA